MNNSKNVVLVSTSFGKIVGLLPYIQREIIQTLYITLYPTEDNLTLGKNNSSSTNTVPTSHSSSKVIGSYAHTTSILSQIDVRILLQKYQNKNEWNINTKNPIDVCYFDHVIKEDIKMIITNKSPNFKTVSLDSSSINEGSFNTTNTQCMCTGVPDKVYSHSVLGGTFDRLHAGHKILLSEAVLRSSKKVTVGVTDGPMLHSKKLWEIIQPCEIRKQRVLDFLQDIEPSLEYDIVSITDMFGPTKDDPSFESLIVSAETQGGGDKVNELRISNNLSPLDVITVPLLPSEDKVDEYEEDKVSSSNLRMRELGTLRKPVMPNHLLPHSPYIIGLTGGIASGKSGVAQYLESKGAGLINCDLLGHRAYDVGTPGNAVVRDLFGEIIALEDGSIDRQKLGAIVFGNEEELNKLNRAIWPLILAQVKEEISRLANTSKVIVVEAAVLLSAGWHNHVHEIWTTFIPEKEAISRLQSRNNLTESEARLRLSSQPHNSEYVDQSHVVFCSLWDIAYTRKQVDRAYSALLTRIQVDTGVPS